MTYFESAEGIMITRDRALKEIADHGLSDEIGTFIDDLGDREEYPAQDVLIAVRRGVDAAVVPLFILRLTYW